MSAHITSQPMLTVEEFERDYGCEKPHYEFWRGEAVQKSLPTWMHGLLQRIIMQLLNASGYKAGSEVKLKIEATFHPVPDIIATRGLVEQPYPTKALEVVVEILSPEDSMFRVLTKCRAYQNWGFEHIYVVDPMERIVFRWVETRLEQVDTLAGIATFEIWKALDAELR